MLRQRCFNGIRKPYHKWMAGVEYQVVVMHILHENKSNINRIDNFVLLLTNVVSVNLV